MKKIIFSLSPASINNAIKELEKYKAEFTAKLTKFVEALTERGVEISKIQIASLGMSTDGAQELAAGMIMRVEGNKGFVVASTRFAGFIEFGTGVVGSDNPHPTMPWSYDVNKHGESGWIFWDEQENRIRWTAGMPSRPFMYRTAQELAKQAIAVAKEVFSG